MTKSHRRTFAWPLWLSLSLLSCQSVTRAPSSTDEAALYRAELTEQLLRAKRDLLVTRNAQRPQTESTELTGSGNEINEVQQNLTLQSSWIAGVKSAEGSNSYNRIETTPRSTSYGFPDRWRNAEDTITLPHTNFVKPDARGQYKTFFVRDLESRSVRVNLRHRILLTKEQLENPPHPIPFLDAVLSCQSPFTLQETFSSKKVRANESVTLKWQDYGMKSEIVMDFEDGFTTCNVRFRTEGTKDIYGFQLAPESQLLSRLDFVQNNVGTCYLPDATAVGPVEQFFLYNGSGSYSCPKRARNVRGLANAEDGIRARAKALLGYEFTTAQVEGNDPYFKFDLSRLPKLDAVFVSSLIFRGDFYGTLMLRMLHAQAERGAQVRIIISESTSDDGDFWRLWDASASQPNIKFVSFKYNPQNIDGMEMFSKYHRSMHNKLFVTYSKAVPKVSTVIIGGRNYADAYAFPEPKDLSKWPLLSQYEEDDWLYFADHETEVVDGDVAREFMKQFLAFYDIDQTSMIVRNANVNITAGKASPEYFRLAPNESLVRHLMSFPFRGDLSLENFYVKAFDSAQKSVKIISPYFSPTELIGKAMQRASARGVKVETITGLSFEGDTAGQFLGEVNKTAANKLMKQVSMYGFDEEGTVLHAKVMVIDGKISLVGSVNLNQRSFYHDSESVMMVYSPVYANEVTKFFEGYKKQTKILTEPMKAVYWKKILMEMVKKEF